MTTRFDRYVAIYVTVEAERRATIISNLTGVPTAHILNVAKREAAGLQISILDILERWRMLAAAGKEISGLLEPSNGELGCGCLKGEAQ